MVNLDDQTVFSKTPASSVVLTSVNALPKQLNQAFTEIQTLSFPPEYKTVQNILVCGMGGSRFPAYIVKELFKDSLSVPYSINDDYIVPKYVNEHTLVVLSSYSGTTEEIIHAGKVALERGAQVVGICAGGDIAALLKKNNKPVYVFDPKYNPSGQPRIGFGYGVGAHIGLMFALGFVKENASTVTEAIAALPTLLASYIVERSEDQNPAKQLAKQLYGKYPYYIVSEFLTGVGNAVANQTNETAKSISSFRIIPELNHHLMEGLKFPNELHTIGTFIFFFSKLYSSSIQKRFHITKDVVEQNKIGTIWHELQGKTKIEQTFELMGLGSYLSMYLSALYEQDPNAIPFVNYFKDQLKKMK